ncbi:MAG: hypothetical protein OXC40_03720 [Proteobacteria bacterium]|nr:hypothetical protein [Pseudomonadota bacterium]
MSLFSKLHKKISSSALWGSLMFMLTNILVTKHKISSRVTWSQIARVRLTILALSLLCLASVSQVLISCSDDPEVSPVDPPPYPDDPGGNPDDPKNENDNTPPDLSQLPSQNKKIPPNICEGNNDGSRCVEQCFRINNVIHNYVTKCIEQCKNQSNGCGGYKTEVEPDIPGL